MSEENLINPMVLRDYRKRRNMTQEQLAEAVKCTKDTVSRWERGTSRRLRSSHRESLCEVLRVSWKELSRTMDVDVTNPRPEPRKTKVTIETSLRNSLQLVAERYAISEDEVITLAPLLLVIVAEKSLLWRRNRLKEIGSTLTEMEEKVTLLSKGLGPRSIRWHDIDDWLVEEEESLNNRDVFGRSISESNLLWNEVDDPIDGIGPFSAYIRELMEGLPKEAVTFISWDEYEDMVDCYMIAEDTFKSLIDLSMGERQDEDFRLWASIFLHGSVDLRQCICERQKRSKSDFREWFTELVRKEEAEFNEWLTERPAGKNVFQLSDF